MSKEALPPRRNRRLAAIAATSVLALSAAGCGGDVNPFNNNETSGPMPKSTSCSGEVSTRWVGKSMRYGLGEKHLETLMDNDRTDKEEVVLWNKIREALDKTTAHVKEKYPDAKDVAPRYFDANVAYDQQNEPTKPYTKAQSEAVTLTTRVEEVLKLKDSTANYHDIFERDNEDVHGNKRKPDEIVFAYIKFRVNGKRGQDERTSCRV